MRGLLALGAVVAGALIAARQLLPSEGRRPVRPEPTLKQRLMARMMEGLPPDSPPKLIISILPRLREQNEEIIALLREQNELLRRGWPEAVTRESKSPG